MANKTPPQWRRFPSGSAAKNLPAAQETPETRVRALAREELLERKWQFTPVLLLENPMDRGA